MDNELIFLIEDKDDFRNFLKSKLENRGYRVETASVAVEAREKFKKLKGLKVVILDLGLPEEEREPPEPDIGFNLLVEIKRFDPCIQVIIVTGTIEEIVGATRAMKGGAYDYILKKEVDGKIEVDENLWDVIERAINEAPMPLPDTKKDLNWVSENMPELQNKYPGKWIAVINEKVITSGDEAPVVYKEIKVMYPQIEPLIYRVPDKDFPWLIDNMPELQKEYAGKWIGVANEEVVASGNEVSEVYDKVKKKYPHRVPLVYSVPKGDELPWI